MLGVLLAETREPLRVLALGAHADDLEIAAGGTIRRLIEELGPLQIEWVVLSGAENRRSEAQSSAERLLDGSSSARVSVEGFRDGFFPYSPDLKDRFERLKAQLDPDVVLTHGLADRHQDHRTVAELTWQTFRQHLVLEYEIPKYDGDLSHPNLFVPISNDGMDRKVDHILRSFPSQRGRRWFSEETFRSIARLRAIESGAATEYAEAFTCRKSVLTFPSPADHPGSAEDLREA